MKDSEYLRRYHLFDELPRMPRWVVPALALLAAWFIGTSLIHVFTEVINWDEFAMLERAERTYRFGKVIGGGRPGLVSIILVPFAKGCIDSVLSVVHARLLWQIFTLLYLSGVYFLVRRWFAYSGRAENGHAQGLLAVALLAFLPAFVVWSVQVRSDQAALAAIVWGGVLLLSKSRWAAVAAGVLFAIGLLCTQKGIYVLGLVGLLYVVAKFAKSQMPGGGRRTELRNAIEHLSFVVLAMTGAFAAYAALVPEVLQLASSQWLSTAAGEMSFYRAGQGHRIYTVHAARLIVHWLLFGILIFSTVRCIRHQDRSEVPVLVASWLVLLLGLTVIWVHGSAFAYFIMTAGLFPALALSMASGRVLAQAGRSAWPVVVSMIALCAVQSAWESVEMFADTQKEQSDTLQLVNDSPLKSRRGYSLEGALLCVRDPDPFPVFFSPGIYNRFFASPSAAKNRKDFMDEFRNRPVAYVVESYRLAKFPVEIREFLSEHYVWYAHSLFIAGYNFSGSDGERDVDVIVPGSYRWDAEGSSPDAALQVGDRQLRDGDTIQFGVGVLRAGIPASEGKGQLLLADLPRPHREGYPFFYLHRQIYQLTGQR